MPAQRPKHRPTPPNWRQRLLVIAIVGSSALYCLGIGAFALKRQLVRSAPAEARASSVATLAPSTPTPINLFPRLARTLEPTPTDAPVIYPTKAPSATPSPHPSQTPPAQPTATAAPSRTPTAVPTHTATCSPTPPTPTPSPSPQPTATAAPSPQPTTTAPPQPQPSATPPGHR